MNVRGLKALVLVILFFGCGQVARAMTSTNFGILWDSINSGGNESGTSSNYSLYDTAGEQATGLGNSGLYKISAGYRVGDFDNNSATLAFEIGTQENSTQTAFTGFSSTTVSTVTVGSVSGYTVGNLIGVVENSGLNEKVATGRITSIAGNILTVDHWDGSPSFISATPSGGDDFVYRMSGYAADFGSLVAGSPKTSLTATRVSTNAANGYNVYVNSDGNLRYSTSTYIMNVADGAVSSGSEEYGWRVFGSSATSTGSDHAFSTSTAMIQQSSVSMNEDGVDLVYKISTTGDTPSGSYSQYVFYTATANF